MSDCPRVVSSTQLTTRWSSVGAKIASMLHDDVWSIHLLSGTTDLLFADTAQASAFDPRVVLLFPPRSGTATGFSIAQDGRLSAQIRDETGWRSAECPPRELTGYALYGLNKVELKPNADVEDGGRIGSRSGLVEVGVNATCETIVTSSDAALKPNAAVFGGVLAGGSVSLGPNATIAGQVLTEQVLTLPGLSCADRSDLAAGALHVTVKKNDITDLEPGAYRHVKVHGLLRLASSRYRFESLSVKPGGHVALASTTGVVRVETHDALESQGTIDSPESSAARLLWVHLGTQPVKFWSLAGTIVAPKATVELRDESLGAVFAKEVTLYPNATLTPRAFRGGW